MVGLRGNRKPLSDALLSPFLPGIGAGWEEYHADLDNHGFSVRGDSCSWQVPWTEVQHKGEDDRVFMFSGKATIFMFGKEYLTDEQQREIRQFAALP